MRKPVAITGMGLLCHMADSPASLWQQVMAPQRQSCLIGPDAPDCQPIEVLPVLADPCAFLGNLRVKRIKSMDRCLHLALASAVRAWSDAGLPLPAQQSDGDPDQSTSETFHLMEAAVVVGSSRGPLEKILSLAQPATRRAAPRLPSDSAFASLHGTLASTLGATGPAFTISTACASGAHAIALAADQIRAGRVPLALAGAGDAPLQPRLVRAMDDTGILDKGPLRPGCRPFSEDRCGTILGEASAFLVLEDPAHAAARGARIHGFLAGAGLAADGYVPSPEAAGARALDIATQQAVRDAGISASEIGYVNAHGTGTVINDAIECEWFQKFTSSRMLPLPFGSTKSATGHCLGATPVLEAIICLEAMNRRCLPPSANCSRPMREAAGALVLDAGRSWDGACAMSNALGFWGAAASLIFQANP